MDESNIKKTAAPVQQPEAYAQEIIDCLAINYGMPDQVKFMTELNRLWYNICDKHLERVTDRVEEYTLRKTALLIMREMAKNNGQALLDHVKELEETMANLSNHSSNDGIGG